MCNFLFLVSFSYLCIKSIKYSKMKIYKGDIAHDLNEGFSLFQYYVSTMSFYQAITVCSQALTDGQTIRLTPKKLLKFQVFCKVCRYIYQMLDMLDVRCRTCQMLDVGHVRCQMLDMLDVRHIFDGNSELGAHGSSETII